MAKAILAFIMTIIVGLVGMVIGQDILHGFPEFGSILAVAIMGAFVIGFNGKKQ